VQEEGEVPGKASRGGAHPNNGTSVGRRYAVAFGGGGASIVVADDATQVLHHGERDKRVRWGSRRARRGTASGSPVKADGGGVSGEIRGGVARPWRPRPTADFKKDEGGGSLLERR
jgi:hypothetical protein